MNTDNRVITWILSGDTGSSSKAICAHMTGARNSEGYSYPCDPSDLGRCLRLLEHFPEWKPRMSEMVVYGTGWIGLVKKWDELSSLMADEVGISWEKGKRAEKTYDAMQQAIADGYRLDKNYKCTFGKDGTLQSAQRIKQVQP